MRKPLLHTKKGEHGTLYLYEIEYDDWDDSGFPLSYWRTWAYDTEHAMENFDDDEFHFRMRRICRVPVDVPRHKWSWRPLPS